MWDAERFKLLWQFCFSTFWLSLFISLPGILYLDLHPTVKSLLSFLSNNWNLVILNFMLCWLYLLKLNFQRHPMTSLATKMTTTMEAHCQTFTKIKLSPVWRMFIVLLFVVTVVFLLTRIFQPRLMGCPSSKPTTEFEVWILEQQHCSG